MKKSMKSIFISVLGVLCALCMSICVLNVALVYADETEQPPLHASFDMVDGAYIRVDAPVGIRFESAILTTDLEALPDDAVFGTIITTKDLLGSYGFDKETPIAMVDIKTNNWLSTTPSTLGADYAGYYGTLVGGTEGAYESLQADYYNTVFVARGYVTYGGETYYTDMIERTIAGIAYEYELREESDTVTQGIVSTAIAEKKATITFNANGGECEETTRDLVIGAILNSNKKPTDPTKTDYTFKGWYYDSAFTQPAFVDENAEILTGNIEVFAKWHKNITKLSASNLTFVGTNGTYESGVYTKTGDYQDSEFILDKTAADDVYEKGNYVVLKVNSSVADTWVTLSNSNTNSTYKHIEDSAYSGIYASNFTQIASDKLPKGIGYAVLEIDYYKSNGGLGTEDKFLFEKNGATESAPYTYTIEEVLICTAQGFEEYKEQQLNAIPKFITLGVDVLDFVGTDTGSWNPNTGVYNKTSKPDNSADFTIDTTGYEDMFINDNWIVIKLSSTTQTWISFPTQADDGYCGAELPQETNNNSSKIGGKNVFAIYQIGAKQAYSWTGLDFYFYGTGEFTIESITVCTTEGLEDYKWQYIRTAAQSKELGADALTFTANNGTYENGVYTKTGATNLNGEFTLSTSAAEELFATDNYIIIKLNSSVGTWMAFDTAVNYNYIGYDASFNRVDNSGRLYMGDGYAIHEINSKVSPAGSNENFYDGTTFYFYAGGTEESPVVYTIQNIIVCNAAYLELLKTGEATI